MNLKDIIAAFIRHRQEVVTRRTMYELRKARERGHILEGLTVALANIDAIIETIKTSANPAEARERLQAGEWAAGGVAACSKKRVLFLYVLMKLKVKIQTVHLVLMVMCIVYLRLKSTRSWNCVSPFDRS
jgi:Type IIA topoisomerase (DNA gyrase/topo II, topoisomerase IV), A subunit